MIKDKRVQSLFRLVLAVIMITILLIAAIIKLIYPSPLLQDFFLLVSIFEIGLAIAIAVFWNHWKMWALLALVFATWGGYSLYAAVFGLPCLCLGVAVDLPQGTSFLFNLLLVILCWVVLKDFKIPYPRTFQLTILTFILVVVGLSGATILYSIRY